MICFKKSEIEICNNCKMLAKKISAEKDLRSKSFSSNHKQGYPKEYLLHIYARHLDAIDKKLYKKAEEYYNKITIIYNKYIEENYSYKVKLKKLILQLNNQEITTSVQMLDYYFVKYKIDLNDKYHNERDFLNKLINISSEYNCKCEFQLLKSVFPKLTENIEEQFAL